MSTYLLSGSLLPNWRTVLHHFVRVVATVGKGFANVPVYLKLIEILLVTGYEKEKNNFEICMN